MAPLRCDFENLIITSSWCGARCGTPPAGRAPGVVRIFLDENFPLGLERRLKNDGYEAEHVITIGWFRGKRDLRPPGFESAATKTITGTYQCAAATYASCKRDAVTGGRTANSAAPG